MGALTVTTLGAARVLHDGVDRTILMRKVLGLAVYLAVTDQPHSRAHLGALLWPDADEAHGLLNLRQTLLRLRQALGSDAETHLRATGDLVRLDLGADGIVDVARLAAATSLHTPPAQRLAALRSYEGAFLAHLTIEDAPDFMDWVAAQRAHWADCYDLIAERHLRWLIDEGQVEEASALGERWVSLRPDSEPAYQLLATAQATGGDVAGARLTLATATRHWALLGLEAPAETTNLRAQLESLSAEITPAWPRRVMRLPFVGRDAALAELRRAFARTQDGEPGAALVQGEAGLGKSRLLRTFARWARVQGADVALGRADELSGRLPYQPLMELLRGRLAREHAPDDLLEDSWLSELQRLVPDLHDRYPDLPAPVDDAAAGARMLEAVAQLGLALAARRPLLWLVDDLHWADEATRDALLYLVKRWQEAQAPALVVCSVRSEELAAAPALDDWMAAAQRATTLTEVALTPLSAEQTTQAVSTLLSESASAEVSAWLQETTQGNPLYLTHVLQAMVERGAIRWEGGKAGERGDVLRLSPDVEVAALAGWLPETLRGVLLRSVKRLDVTAQQTLAAAAVIGTRFDEGLLLQVAGVEEEAVLSALELAELRLLIRAEVGGYRFAHDAVAEAIYSDLTLARRRIFHRRALATLQTVKSRSPAELARHALAAGDWEAAARQSLLAAEAAELVGAHRDALRQYEQVVRLLTTAPSREALQAHFSDEAREEVYSALGMLYDVLGEKEEARALFAELLTEARLRGAHALEGRALYLQGRHALTFEREFSTAQDVLEESRQIASEQGDISGLLLAERLLVVAALELENISHAWDYAQHLEQRARESGQHLRLAQGLTEVAEVHMLRGEWEAACAATEESLLLFARLADKAATTAEQPPYVFVTGLSWAAFAAQVAQLARPKPTRDNAMLRRWGANGLIWMGIRRLHLGEGDIGREALQMAWRIFVESKEQRFLHHYLLQRILGWLEAGDYERSLHEIQRTLEQMTTALEQPIDPKNIKTCCALVDAHCALFQVAPAREFLEQASAYAAGKPVWDRLLPASRWCTQHALAGDWAAAAAAAREAQALRDALPGPLTWFDFARYLETEALLRAGDRLHAQADVERLREGFGANRRYRLMYLRMQALLDRDVNDHAAVIAHLLQALDLAAEMGLPGEEWQIAADLAATYASTEDAERAAEARGRAERVVASLADRITDLPLRERFSRTALARRPALA
jgi:DNA-binding SARP family transcriptional activator